MNIFLVIIILFVSSISLYAKEDATSFPILTELASPVTTEAKKTLYWGSGAVLLSILFNDNISRPLERESVQHKPLGEFSQIGDFLGRLVPNALYVIGMGVDVHWGKSGTTLSIDNAKIMAKATIYASAVTTVLKYTVREKRPARESRNSFPSGHTTTAFAFSSVVGELHGWRWGVPAYAMAVFVGYSRINDEQHYLRDVLAGATIGMGYGIALCRLHKRTNSDEQMAIIPIPLKDGVAIIGNFSF